ncbi:hypothetical protein KGF54_000421 [Candida jiufengensis]|uniref:uncharacterized protein n=1 Tax=Candida jiufengensis TaxID=497108 RepID=UPI002225AFF3|nr:uncharacterized protein KGF54_000421 [Candida jiufengensis]KAI5956804.1 hypothetical protein KGF54_000421 [Candida jiufengensis]
MSNNNHIHNHNQNENNNHNNNNNENEHHHHHHIEPPIVISSVNDPIDLPDSTSIASLASSEEGSIHHNHKQHQVNPIHHNHSKSSHSSQHSPNNQILGPLSDLEKSITSFENLQKQQEKENLQRQQTSLTTSSKKTLIVPRPEKRGLLASLVLVPEYYDARDYSPRIKYLIVFLIAFASITGPMGTSIMLPAIDDIVKKLHTTGSEVNVSVGIYLLSLGIFPLWWSSFSERYGRRSVYIISFVLFVGFSIGTALAPNISALIVLRVLQGGSSASVQAVGAGTIADLFAPQDRGVAMGWYYLGPLMGPFLAPILGGAVSQAWGWRATQWLLMIFACCNLISMTFLLPETLRKVDNINAIRNLMQQQEQQTQDDEKEKFDSDSSDQQHAHEPPQQLNDETLQRVATNLSRRSSARSVNSYIEDGDDEGPIVDPVMPTLSRLTTNRSTYSRRLQQDYVTGEIRKTTSHISEHPTIKENKWSQYKTTSYDLFIRPLHSIILLKHPPVILVIMYSGISFAVIYFFNMTISYQYARPPYNFSQVIVGLMYIPNSITYLAASMIGGRWNDRLLNKYAEKHGELIPESRISWNIVLAIILYPMACLIFGWTIRYGEFWIVPLIGTSLCGFASMLVIGATVTYLVDTLPGKGATGVALNNLIRQILAAIATFIVEPLLKAIGAGILFSILTGILTVASLILLYLKKKGGYFREHYDLMKLYEKL